MKVFKRYKKRIALGGLVGILIAYYFCLPQPLFDHPTSTVLLDAEGGLLGAKIATDGQWRFPHNPIVPDKFRAAIIAFEDKRFERHWGVDLWALGRAFQLNWEQGRTVSGGSTLTMQTIRLSRDNPARTIPEKILEIILATRLEWTYSKDEILAFYASNAPFGGNVVGLDAAAWKYFQRAVTDLSWAEACMLAVLPNSPSLIHLGRNRERLRTKRNKLLDKLQTRGILDSTSCTLAKLEPLPQRPEPLPRLSPHLLERVHQEWVITGKHTGVIHSTIQKNLQERLNVVLDRHHQHLLTNEIHNAAALIIDVPTGNVVAYVGNVTEGKAEHSPDVDIVTAPRSTGSILKPFLYAAMLHDGQALSQMLFPDVPSNFGSYRPLNYDKSFDGVVPANEVITRSLNIPTVHMLQDYGVARFANKLRRLGMTTLHRSAPDYGLSLILGGAEASLWDLGGIYASMARNLTDFNSYNAQYDPNAFRPLNYKLDQTHERLDATAPGLEGHSLLRAGAIWHTFQAMQEVVRPGLDALWKSFPSAQRVAWKTGTSFGFRDAWAVGCTPDYVVAVWVGNADGEGRPGLVGVEVAAPILFDAFSLLETGTEWFEEPHDDFVALSICKESGHLATAACTETVVRHELAGATHTKPCPYHQTVHLSPEGNWRVHADCESPARMQTKSFFVLPPVQSYYYSRKQPNYEKLPPFREDCLAGATSNSPLALVYPSTHIKIYVPVNLDETRSRTVFEAKHRRPTSTLYWHLDNTYVGTTKELHYLDLDPPPGNHVITVVDEQGNEVKQTFEIVTGTKPNQ